MTDGFVRLDDVAVLRFSGSAARGFLGRQLTCDVDTLAPGHGVLGAWLSAKGRALCLLHLVDPGDGSVLALLPRELAGTVATRMGMFVLRDDVRIEPDDGLVALGLAGSAIDAAGAAVRPVSVAPSPRLAIAVTAAAGTLEAELETRGVQRLSPGQWDLLQVRAGVPRVVEATREAFVPQMINLDLLGAVSFGKGCYPGQEIVARTQHLGRIKRRAFIARCDASAPAAVPGDPLVADGDAEPVGRVVIGAAADGTQEMLAVLSLDAVGEGRPMRLRDAAGPLLEISRPPYLPDASGG